MPAGKYLYVTDYTASNVLGFSVASGLLTPLAGNPFPAGTAPSAIVVDPSFAFAYVANSTDSTVTAYSISNGALTRLGSLLRTACSPWPSESILRPTIFFTPPTFWATTSAALS